MIDKLKIKNFQSNVDSELTFSKGVNLIIGETDTGKSAIFRSINWILTNLPLGKSFINWNSKGAEVSLLLDDTLITRIRDNKLNVYVDSNGNKYTAGHGVPEEVNSFLNIRPEINIQQQIGQPFLLQKSPGEVAQFFNSITGISDIDKSVKYIKSNISKLDSTIKVHSKEKKRLESELESYEYLDEAEKDIQLIEHLHNNKSTKQKESNYLAGILNEIDTCQEKLESLTGKYNALPALNEIQESLKTLESYEDKMTVLRGLIDRIKTIQINYNQKVKKYEQLKTDFENAFPDICPLCNRNN